MHTNICEYGLIPIFFLEREGHNNIHLQYYMR